MSILNGPFDLKGSFGNYRIYKDPVLGITVFSGKGGPSAEQMATLDTLAYARGVRARTGWAQQMGFKSQVEFF